jgi:hypothetical protein
MRGCLLNLVTVLALLASLFLWLHSQLGRCELLFVSRSRTYLVGSARGSVRAEVNDYGGLPVRLSDGLHTYMGFFVSHWDPNPPGRFGFGYLDGTPKDRYADRRITRRRAVAAPWWLIVASLTMLGTRPLIRSLRRQRWTDSNCCPSCGYDLRASRERCPECGTIAPSQPAP